MTKAWIHIRETIERHGTAAMVSVVKSAGSVPRASGARLVLRADGCFFGTIGGGRLEYEAIAVAGRMLSQGRGAARLWEWPLGPNLGQCCGGRVTTLAETFDTNDLETVRRLELAERSGPFVTLSRVDSNGRIVRSIIEGAAASVTKTLATFEPTGFYEGFGDFATPVLLFGAGHVGRAVVLALAPLPFTIRWIDSRPDQFPSHLPLNTAAVCSGDANRELDGAPPGTAVVVMTHSHAIDFDIALYALQRNTVDFVGLIGSETKRARFLSWARQFEVSETLIGRLTCPIGIPQIKGKEPAVIAASLAAQLLMVRNRPAMSGEAIQSPTVTISEALPADPS